MQGFCTFPRYQCEGLLIIKDLRLSLFGPLFARCIVLGAISTSYAFPLIGPNLITGSPARRPVALCLPRGRGLAK